MVPFTVFIGVKENENRGICMGFGNEVIVRVFTASHAIRGIPTIVWRVRRGLSRPQKTQPFVEVEAS